WPGSCSAPPACSRSRTRRRRSCRCSDAPSTSVPPRPASRSRSSSSRSRSAHGSGGRCRIGGAASARSCSRACCSSRRRSARRPIEGGRWGGVGRQLRNRQLLQATAAGSAFYFTFVGTFSYVVFRLERPPFSFGPAAGSAVFALWLLGFSGPALGTLADRIGWRRLAFAAFAATAAGLAISLPAYLPTLVLGLAP